MTTHTTPNEPAAVPPTPPPAPPPPPPRRGGSTARSPRAWAVLLVSLLLTLGIDLGSKSLAFRHIADDPVLVEREDVVSVGRENPRRISSLIPDHRPVVVVPHVLELTLVLNPGAVFGMGAGQRWFFIGFTVVAVGFGLWMFASWTGPRDAVAHAAIGMLLGGGLGNLYDRLVYACVRDFLHPLPGVKFPFGWKPLGGNGEVWPYVSNIADLFLLIGIGLLLVFLLRKPQGEGTRD